MAGQELVLFTDGPITAEPLQSIPMKPPRRNFDRNFYADILVKSSITGDPAQKTFKCDVCGKTFSSHQALGGHKSSHNVNKKRVFAEDHPKVNEKSSKKRPKSSENESDFECDVCHKTFASHQALGGHKSSHFYDKNSRKNNVKRPTYFQLFPDGSDPSQTASTSYQTAESASSCLEDIDLELRL